MQGGFTVSLLEILAYLVPGAAALSVLVYQWVPSLASAVQKDFWAQVAFLAASYVVGHLLMVLSVVVLGMRGLLQKLRKRPRREQRMTYYSELSRELQNLFGSQISRYEEYVLSLQIVVDRLPQSNQDVARLYALTLFCRNMVVALFIAAISLAFVSIPVGLACIGLSLLFFFRYVDLESATTDSVFRAAYVYIKECKPTLLQQQEPKPGIAREMRDAGGSS